MSSNEMKTFPEGCKDCGGSCCVEVVSGPMYKCGKTPWRGEELTLEKLRQKFPEDKAQLETHICGEINPGKSTEKRRSILIDERIEAASRAFPLFPEAKYILSILCMDSQYAFLFSDDFINYLPCSICHLIQFGT